MPRFDLVQRRRAVDLYRSGLTVSEVAGALAVSPTWVLKILQASNIARRPQVRRSVIDGKNRATLLRMRADGAGIVAIGRELEISYSAVYEFLRRRELKALNGGSGPPGRRLSDEHRRAIVAELERGDTLVSIADRHGTSKQNVSLIAKRHGLARRKRRTS